jgi:hypothetical protein
MHRQFLDERARRKEAKERGESHVAGSSLNKGKLNKEMEDVLSTPLLSASTWSTAPDLASGSGAGGTKKIRIGASIDSSGRTAQAPAPPPVSATTASGDSIVTTISDEAKKKGEKGALEEEDEEGGDGEGDEEEAMLVYDYDGGGMGDDYDDEGDDEYY